MFIVNGQENKEVLIDSSFLFGRGLFETINVLEKPLFLKEHVDRINSSAKKFGINNKFNLLEVEEEVKKRNIKNKVLKLILTDKNKILTTRENPYNNKTYELGFSLCISKVRRNSTSLLSFVKSVNYIENLLEKSHAKEKGFDEVIFLNEHGKITETSSSNIFFIRDEKIYTPKVQCGLLPGIIREFIINNFDVTQGSFTLGDVLKSDEIFLTNSVLGIVRVNKIENKIFKDFKQTLKIIKRYEEKIGGSYGR